MGEINININPGIPTLGKTGDKTQLDSILVLQLHKQAQKDSYPSEYEQKHKAKQSYIEH